MILHTQKARGKGNNEKRDYVTDEEEVENADKQDNRIRKKL
jgi:hypothetical protein